MSDQASKPRWFVRCSCGWSTTLSAEWAAQSAAKIHARLGWTAKEHAVTVQIEDPQREAKDQPQSARDEAQDQPSLWDQMARSGVPSLNGRTSR
jgi:hypothetical protein